jgi:di/tricarboxylate transporter
MAPIVLSASSDMGISPYALMMGIAMAASASFMTPISHPANILVIPPTFWLWARAVTALLII